MYSILLNIHSWLRWVVLILAVIAIVQALLGWLAKGKYGKLQNIIAASFVGTMHLQLIIGLLLYIVFSPITTAAFSDFGAAMKNSAIRFWAVEHIFVMILAVILVQLGRTFSKKSRTTVKKHRVSFIYFTIALVLMLSRIPFPWTSISRTLFPI